MMNNQNQQDVLYPLKTISNKLRECFPAREIIVFGSYATGKIHEDSDIDILIITDTKEKFHNRVATVLKALRGVIKYTPISPIVMTDEELKIQIDKDNQFIKEILENGIRI